MPRRLNLPLTKFLPDSFLCGGKEVYRDLDVRMNVIGEIPPCATLTKRTRASTSPGGDRLTNIATRNRSIIDPPRRSPNRELALNFWELSGNAREKGWLANPTHATLLYMAALVKSPRFRTAEQPGEQERKFGITDALTKSLVNIDVMVEETYILRELNAFVNLAREQPINCERTDRIRPVDFPRDYETIGARPDSDSEPYVFFFGPNENEVYKAKPLARPFWCWRAPANWGCVATSPSYCPYAYSVWPRGAYVVDVFEAPSSRVAKSGFWISNICAKYSVA